MHSKHPLLISLSTLLLLILFAQMLFSAVQQSPTYDEGYYLVSGYAFVRLGDLHIRDGAPILLSALHTLPLLELPGVRLPLDDPAWGGSDFHPISEQFMWQVNPNADQIIFLARAPAMLLTLLLAAFVGRWAGELFGPWGGLLALGLCAFDPNIIAHGALAATDGGAAALMLIATYWLWRWLDKEGWTNLLLAGALFGLAQCTRFSALLLAPIWALLWGWQMVRQGVRRWPRWIGAGLLVVLVAYLAIWATHGFQIGPVAGKTAFPVPAPAWWEELFYIVERMGRPAQAFLLGELYEGGRWLYFPVALAIKTPIPTLILLLGAAAVGVRTKKWISPTVWLPPLLFFAISLTSNLNLGYRYILPILPFLFVLAGRMGAWLAEGLAVWRGERRALLLAAITLVGGWSVWGALSVYPHYLAFFNEWAGGPEGGWRYLVDSNLDWGQGLKGLKRWMDKNGVERVKLAYMGEAYPSYYGIEFDPLPSLPDRWQHPLYHPFYPHDPAPGIYAISATLLQGGNLADPDTFAWFRQREPMTKIGYSMFIYDVPKYGTGQAVIGLAGLAPPDIHPQDYALLGTNDVRVLWFDAARSLVFPADGAGWWFAGGDASFHPILARWQPVAPARESTLDDGRSLHVWPAAGPQAVAQYLDERRVESPAWLLAAATFMPDDPDGRGTRLALPVDFERVELLGYALAGAMSPDDRLVLVTYWRVKQPIDRPLTLFVHLLDAAGVNRAGEDRCDVWHDNLQVGDVFAQVQEVAWNNDLAVGVYQVELGWYDPATMLRLPVRVGGQAVADRALLSPVEVGQR